MIQKGPCATTAEQNSDVITNSVKCIIANRRQVILQLPRSKSSFSNYGYNYWDDDNRYAHAKSGRIQDFQKGWVGRGGGKGGGVVILTR